LPRKKTIVKTKEVKNRIELFQTNLAGFSKKGHGSKRGCFAKDDKSVACTVLYFFTCKTHDYEST
jgi:hypothetical protein